ncbi:hypothetical protein [Pseudonocardia abyssalis]|uniref:Uncharacterized protein n=1 Tax=Pseudonocardia abyssalis TaxID=2792008 RepID=A0ABS6UX11_9PSEU|nr:hypothetical protein [Pseudonocardia abyssalis]MBW0117551.1 hypothetical protein [Pseudonocardia abyssalis]MBW0136408.1 hypothetical protein [Pseudonocardia abyssalis]
MRALRKVSGVLAGGLVVLAVALGVAWVAATRTGAPGPAGSFLAWHAVAAVAAVVAQIRADRAPDGRGAGAALVVLVISAVVLAALWLA